MPGERMEVEGMREIEEQGERVESEDEEDEEDREYERQQNEGEIGGQDVMEETEGEGMDVEESAGELEGTELNEECGEGDGEVRGNEVRGGTELEEREEWPMWLRNAMDMLHSGERGRVLESVLVKFVTIEKALGFKGEKTVSEKNTRN